MKHKLLHALCVALLLIPVLANAQSFLPPVMKWHGKSEALIAKANHPWITPAERSDFVNTPDYAETMSWFRKLADSSALLTMISIGKSVEGREIWMLIASSEKNVTAAALKNSAKPLLLAQAGIHSGEIDGKDAAMMLLRDMAFGNKQSLLDKVNFLFIPILNVDGHERSSPFNRPNQRGPENQGWRTNAQNLNLNRDYAKLDTKEIRSVINVINEHDPDLYMDIHVTDGADYQYDITFGGVGTDGYSVEIVRWLENQFKTNVDRDLVKAGHIPGPLIFPIDDRDFSKGIIGETGGPRFSNGYGDVRHLATVLVENHSLKPYKQRVLGTYILLESTIRLLGSDGHSLKQRTEKDKAVRKSKLAMEWKVPQFAAPASTDTSGNTKRADSGMQIPDSLKLAGISSVLKKSAATNSTYIEWLGKTVTMTIPHYKATQPVTLIQRPKGYWLPPSCDEVIERLKMHGIVMRTITTPATVDVEMYRITDHKFGDDNNAVKPFEGRMQVTGATQSEMRKQTFPAGSVFISTDQPLGDLAMILLEPRSKDSYFSWGFFNSIFQRTEYIESYVMEPMAKKMLEDSPALRKEFEEKKAKDNKFANDPNAMLTWFYSKTKYFDDRYLLYPVGREL